MLNDLENIVQTLENKVKALEGMLTGEAGVMSGWIPGGGAGGGLDYDYLFVGTRKVTPPERTTDFLKVYLDGTTPEWVASMPETQDSNAVVFDVRKNRIYLSGEFGSG